MSAPVFGAAEEQAWRIVLDAIEDAMDVDGLRAFDRGALAELHERAGWYIGMKPLSPPTHDEPPTGALYNGPDQVSILFRFGVTSDVHFALAGAGLVRVGDVEDAIDDELLRICGIGPKRVAMIRRAIRRYREQASTSAGAP
jgi:hypothetical protein